MSEWQLTAYKSETREGVIENPELIELFDARPKATFYDLWDEAGHRGIAYLARAGGATYQQIALALCAVSRLCVHIIPEVDRHIHLTALERVEAWARGEMDFPTKDYYSIPIRYGVGIELHAAYSTFATYQYAVFLHLPNRGDFYRFSFSAPAFVVDAGIDSRIVCATLRKHLPFERPP